MKRGFLCGPVLPPPGPLRDDFTNLVACVENGAADEREAEEPVRIRLHAAREPSRRAPAHLTTEL